MNEEEKRPLTRREFVAAAARGLFAVGLGAGGYMLSVGRSGDRAAVGRQTCTAAPTVGCRACGEVGTCMVPKAISARRLRTDG